MKTPITVIALLAAAAAFLAAGHATAQLPSGRIVNVDLDRVFNEYYKTPLATAKLKETAEGYTKELEEMLTRFKKETEALNKLREEQDKTEYTAEIREQKKKAVQDKLTEVSKIQREIEDYKRSHQQELERQTQRMRTGIIKEITDVIGKEARDSGYSYVLDKSGRTLNGVAAVIYAQDSLDITDDILKVLNKNKPKMDEPAPKKSDTK
jgi:Skp family chaperone for outer membrane proteins